MASLPHSLGRLLGSRHGYADDIAAGQPGAQRVLSFDGRQLGLVAGVHGEHIRIHRRIGRDYCLGTSLVYRFNDDTVRMYVPWTSVQRYRSCCDGACSRDVHPLRSFERVSPAHGVAHASALPGSPPAAPQRRPGPEG